MGTMDMNHNLLALALMAASAHVSAPALSAQHMISETVVPGSVSIASVVGNGNVVYISQFVNSLQSTWSVANPLAPSIFSNTLNPPFGDQWNDSHYYSGEEGMFLFQACRFGGLNMIDVSEPTAITVVDSVSTNYHWDGLETWTHPRSGKLYLAASEASTFPGGVGGLLIYEVTSQGMTLVASELLPQVQGFDLKFSPDGRYIYQLATATWNPSFESNLYVYDLGDPKLPNYPTPVLCASPIIAANPANAGAQLEITSTGDRVYIAQGTDGLWTADLTVPCSPVLNSLIAPIPGATFTTLSRYKDFDNLFIGSAYFATPGSSFIFGIEVLDPVSIPADYELLFVEPTGISVGTIQIDHGRAFVGGNKAGSGVFQIWI